MKNIIFLDIDGVLNCETFFLERIKEKNATKSDYYKSQICPVRMKWFSDLCTTVNADVVISSTWRKGKSIEELQTIMDHCGGTFEIIGKTQDLGFERGIEIAKWLRDNIKMENYGCEYYDFYRYAIIDDDNDMLLLQQNHFFQTDNYSGLTPNICHRMKRFFTHKAF